MKEPLIKRFRRYPAKYIGTLPFGRGLRALYERLDFGGKLSDFIADPVQLFERASRYHYAHDRRMSLVSVVLATRNNEETILQAIAGLLNQTHRRLEIIVIDDCSTDRTPEVIASLALCDSRVKLLRNDTQLGAAESRNRGLKVATGDYVTFQDGDDLSHPRRIELQLRSLHESNGKMLSLCNYVRFDERGRTLKVNNARVMKCIISMMFPRLAILRDVGFMTALAVGEDSEFYQRIKSRYGPESETIVFRTLYRARFSPRSLLFGNAELKMREGEVFFKLGSR